MQHVDVADRSEIPAAPAGWRYLDFLGGESELRAFLVPEAMPRTAFYDHHADLLDPVLAPIYTCDGISARQDASYALPGFYIVSFAQQYASIDAMDPVTHLRAAFVIRELRRAMREALGIPYIHLHYEEKPAASCNVHYWLMPVLDPRTQTSPTITRLNIKDYLRQFRFRDTRARIQHCNDEMVRYLEAADLAARDRALAHTLAGIQ